MGGYLAYPEYKDSGVEWLGKIPSHWEPAGLTKYLQSLVDYRGKTPEKTKSGVFLVTAKNIKNGVIDYSLSQEFVDDEQYDEIMRRGKPQIGDVLLTTEAPLGEVANVDNVDIALAQRVIKMQGRKDILDNYFLKYWIMSAVFQQHLSSLCTGSTALGIKASKLCLLRVVLPTVIEQQTIAHFLDYKTAQIDALIAKKESLLAKLAEKRTALISQAVTKGLDPTALLKPSDIEWLGDIPAHWEIMVLKRLAEVRGGVTKGRKLDNVETLELPYLRVANVQDGHIDTTGMSNIEITPDEVERYSLKAGDVLMNEGGDNDKLGRGAVWDARIDPCLHQNHVFAVRPYEKGLSSWLALITSSSYAKFYFFSKAKQTTNLASISATNIKLLPVVLPPESERNQILEFLKTQDLEHDQATERISEAVNKLKEYRTALITNAVTGKIDVRDVKLPEPESLEVA